MKKKPETPRDFALYRAVWSCEDGMKTMNGEKRLNTTDATPQEYAMYCLMAAVKDLAKAMQEEKQ